ncbi:hypothetical protein GFV16_06345 [Bacillus megaterium]|uniref:NACHT domain-containing protein n=1 Tax=Priestia megaterium TaxID=1404 RepID=UPI001293E502|nr:hypothetical protein [Priestia megaterium]MQR85559.1 hypothetical protein [Priestia megaterium]
MLEIGKVIGTILKVAQPAMKKGIERNATVIKVLKKLKLDPTHPPNDFDAVYAYTLVEFGVGQSKLILEFFSDKYVKDLFHEFYNRRDKGKFEEESEELLKWHRKGEIFSQREINPASKLDEFFLTFNNVIETVLKPTDINIKHQINNTYQKIEDVHKDVNQILGKLDNDQQNSNLIAYPGVPNYIPRKLIHASEYNSFNKDTSILNIVKDKKKVALLGGAGTGKSVELRQLAHICSDESNEFYPIFITLNSYVKRTLFKVLDEYSPKWTSVPQDKLLIILDGLDEVGNKNREDTVKFIEQFIRQQPDANIVLSCRQNFYFTEKSDFSGTIEGLNSYYLQELDRESFCSYISNKLMSETEDFLKLIQNLGFSDMMKIPFYLVKIVELYKKESTLPENRISLLEKLFTDTIKNDINHYKNEENLEDLQPKVNHLLERMAFSVELMGKSALTKAEYYNLVPDVNDRNILDKCSIWKRVDRGKERHWMFEHKNFQEYLAAKVLYRQLDFTLVKKLISFPIDYEPIIPSWINTLSFLIGMIEQEHPWFEELFQWLYKNNPEIIMHFERERIEEGKRDEVFKTIFYSYSNKKALLYSDRADAKRIDARRIAYFSESLDTIDFLIDKICQPENYVAIVNAIHLLSHMNIPLNRRKTVRNLLFRTGMSEKREIIQHKAVDTLFRLNLQTVDIANKVLNKFQTSKSVKMRISLYSFLIDKNLVDEHIKVLVEGLKIINDEDYTQPGQHIVDFLIAKLIKDIKSIESMEIILKTFINNLSELEKIVVDGKIVKNYFDCVVEKCVQLYDIENNLLPLALELFEKLVDENLSEQAITFSVFFEKTKTNYTAFLKFYEKFPYNFSSFGLSLLLNNKVMEYLVTEVKKERLSKAAIINLITISVSCGKKIDDKFINEFKGGDLTPQVDQTKIRKEKVKENINILFNRSLFIEHIKLTFQYMDSDDLTLNGLNELEFSGNGNYNYLIGDFLKELIYVGVVHINLKGVITHVNSLDWELHIVMGIFKYLNDRYDKKLIELSDDQRSFIEQWCYKTLKNANYKQALIQYEIQDYDNSYQYVIYCDEIYICLWYFLKEFDLEYPNDVLLDMLSFDWFTSTEKVYYRGIEYLELLLDEEQIYERIWDNIENGIKIDRVLKNHLHFCYRHKIVEIVPYALTMLKEPKNSISVCKEALKIIIEFSKEYEGLANCLPHIKNNFKWKVIECLFELEQGYRCLDFLLYELKNSDDYSDKLRAASYLIYLNRQEGLKFFVKWLELNNELPQEYIFNTREIFKSIKSDIFLPYLFQALKLTYLNRLNSYANTELKEQIQECIVTIGIKNKTNFFLVKSIIESIIKEYCNLEEVPSLNTLIEILEKQFILSQNVENDIDTTIKLLKKLQLL